MSHRLPRLALTAALVVLAAAPASAANCISGPRAFLLADDVVNWSMTIQPGRECIQGLRWSTMQLDNVTIQSPPKSGRVVLVGPAFRYYASADARGLDTFTVSVSGTNRKTYGHSTIEVEVRNP